MSTDPPKPIFSTKDFEVLKDNIFFNKVDAFHIIVQDSFIYYVFFQAFYNNQMHYLN